MEQLTAAMLKTLMEASLAGFGPELDVDNFLDRTFDELGFDSLSLVELSEQLNDHLGIGIPDDLTEQSGTPRILLSRVNEVLANADA